MYGDIITTRACFSITHNQSGMFFRLGRKKSRYSLLMVTSYGPGTRAELKNRGVERKISDDLRIRVFIDERNNMISQLYYTFRHIIITRMNQGRVVSYDPVFIGHSRSTGVRLTTGTKSVSSVQYFKRHNNCWDVENRTFINREMYKNPADPRRTFDLAPGVRDTLRTDNSRSGSSSRTVYANALR